MTDARSNSTTTAYHSFYGYAGNSYTTHKHTVTVAFGNSYGYDANGNQTSRTIGGVTYTFTYDYENRAQRAPAAIRGGSVSATFVYDADGNRVKSTVGGVTTVYLAGLYEFIENGATDKVTKYYEGNTLRRTGYGVDDGIFYTLRDHLNSSSVIVNQTGTVVTPNSNQYFYPFGGNHSAAFNAVTTKRFTGQYHESGLPGGEGLSYSLMLRTGPKGHPAAISGGSRQGCRRSQEGLRNMSYSRNGLIATTVTICSSSLR